MHEGTPKPRIVCSLSVTDKHDSNETAKRWVTMAQARIPSFTMNNGTEIPAQGFGTFQMSGDEVRKTLPSVFDLGIRHIDTAEAYHNEVAVGQAVKVRALGASEMYAYQFHDMQVAAEENGWTKFTSMQLHYNLLYREDEREMIPVCRQYDVALTPYSPLASGHLARPTGESDSVRGRTDKVEKQKYDSAEDIDLPIVKRVQSLADRHGVPMARIALAWQWAKGITAPIVGCSKPERVDDAVAALDVELTPDEVAYLDEPYRAHELVGPLARPGEKALAGTTDPNAKR